MRCWGRRDMRNRVLGNRAERLEQSFRAGNEDNGQLQLGRESAERGKTVGAKTERERAYIAAVGKLYGDFQNTPQRARLIAYRDAMGEVAAKYPEDHEAQIFYALAIAASKIPRTRPTRGG